MIVSRHYENERIKRDELIATIGEGKVIYTTIQYDSKRKREYKYEITDNAVLIVKATDIDMVITKMIARPSRLKAYWENVPHDILMKAVEHTKKKMYIQVLTNT